MPGRKAESWKDRPETLAGDSSDCSMRLVPQLDRHPKLIALIQAPAGKIAAAVLFALLLFLNGEPRFLELAAFVLAMSFLPELRRTLLSAPPHFAG
ncbi:MAG TPA: hypothetical protein VMH81_10415 [Bryobacteraceae bacterium]|nr:hypothetical protein [Bryobacteraceae bacterium]